MTAFGCKADINRLVALAHSVEIDPKRTLGDRKFRNAAGKENHLSERFRPAQRTSRPLCGRLIMRPADCVGGGRAHESFVVANPRRGSVMIDIRRRDFIALLGDTAAWHCKPRTQQPEQTRRGEPMDYDAVTKVRPHHSIKVKSTAILLIVAAAFFPGRVAAQYKQEFKLSVIPNRETSWGRAAIRFADGVKFRTNGRIQIKTYFDGQLFAGQQTTEFQLLQQGVADFVIGSTINWSPQVKKLNLFSLPFMFPTHAALDASVSGEPGK